MLLIAATLVTPVAVGALWLRLSLLNEDRYVHTVVSKLLTYALGRGVDYYDAPSIRAIVRDARSQDFRVSSLILGVVKSPPFQMRTSR